MVSKYVHHVRSETIRVDKPHAAQAEVSAIIDVGIAMRALISSCEYFTRSAKSNLRNGGMWRYIYICGYGFMNIANIVSLNMIFM